MTYFTVRAHTGTASATADIGKAREKFLGKNEGERTGQIELKQEEIPGSRQSMQGYILTDSRL